MIDIIERLNNIAINAESRMMRLLIEIEPDYNKIYLYTERDNRQYMQQQVICNKIYCKVRYIFTDERVYYPDIFPVVKMLKLPKDKIYKRFYNPKVPVTEYKLNENTVKFIEIKKEFVDKNKLLGFAMDIDILSIRHVYNQFSKLKIDGCKVNVLNKSTLAFYQY